MASSPGDSSTDSLGGDLLLTSPTSPASMSLFCSASPGSENNIPQWKRELIQRRRQQHQQSSLVGSTATTTGGCSSEFRGGAAPAAVISTVAAASVTAAESRTSSTPAGDDALVVVGATTNGASNNMRLDTSADSPAKCRSTPKDVLELVEKMRNSPRSPNNIKQDKEDYCESDSSEELQYGPGIVHKLRSKYLNMTLREMNKNRPSVQCFRRAASLEDLLDCKDETPEKARRYAKKNVTGAAAKVERYRNAARGNESIKRARSVETLMRYNSAASEENSPSPQNNHTSRYVSNVLKQENNDHIILVDRTTVKIENRLLDKDRLKPINKPKRIKPVLAETERPPPDLVKTTLRIFEGTSVKKCKPKGEVALKVATFKTINDTFKAQNQKKIIPKPPLQPKPFTNGNSKISTSPRKIVITRKSTAELIEQQISQELYHNDGVITEPIIHSVSSVVSKFQQIEKSSSPSSSPEPSFNKVKFSPAPSPEPFIGKTKVSSLDLKSPTMTTPIPSPRSTPPKPLTPVSPKSDMAKPPLPFIPKSVLNSTPIVSKIEPPKLLTSPELVMGKIDFERDKSDSNVEQIKEATLEVNNQNEEIINEKCKSSETLSPEPLDETVLLENLDDTAETTDSPRSVSKSALDNISKAGVTVQFSFNDHPCNKTYLPKLDINLQNPDSTLESEAELSNLEESNNISSFAETQSVSTPNLLPTAAESLINLQERLQADSFDEIIYKEDTANETKSVGAISSLALIKSTMTTSYSQGNESKTIRSQKSDSNSPPQKQIGIIRPLVSTKTQLPQQNLSNREIEKNLINRVKSIEQHQPTKVVVSLKSAEEIQPVKKNNSSGGLWDSKPWNQQNNTMVFNFSDRKDVPDYIENDGLIIHRKRDNVRVSFIYFTFTAYY